MARKPAVSRPAARPRAQTSLSGVFVLVAVSTVFLLAASGCKRSTRPPVLPAADVFAADADQLQASGVDTSGAAVSGRREAPSLIDPLQSGIRYLNAIDAPPAYQLLIEAILHRHLHIEAFEGSAAAYSAYLQARPDAVEQRRFLRVLDGCHQQAFEISSLPAVDQLTLPPLYCSGPEQMAAWSQLVADALGRRDTGVTHALMGYLFGRASGCRDEALDVHGDALLSAVGALVEPEDGLSDLEVEAMALLMSADARALVSTDALGALVEARNADGGWGELHEPSNWHTTGLAVWVLSAAQLPAAERGPIAAERGRCPDL